MVLKYGCYCRKPAKNWIIVVFILRGKMRNIGTVYLLCGNKMPTRCNRGFYWRSYCLLNMFRAPLCPSPGAQDYYTVVAACGFQVVGLVWSWGLCKNNIKMDLQEVGGGCEDWMELTQDRDRLRALVSMVKNFRVSKMRGISWLAAEPVNFSRRTLLHGVTK